ncbi:MAG: hypothetical protein K8Q99_03455 [Acholeplasmataceae bacterium]|nr:hypothetical protein [Acholeplasmataceae bacterium]
MAEQEILVCFSNKVNKKCDNDALFIETFDEMLISQINNILKHKDEFLNSLRKALLIHPAIIDLNSRLQQAQEKLDEYDAKLRNLMSSSDDLDKLVRDEIISLKNETELDLLKSKNALLTTHNISSVIKKIKALLNTHKVPIESITDFSFRDLFTKVIVHDRDHIEFVINAFQSPYQKSVYSFPSIETEYIIRKTKHKAQSVINLY